MSDFAIKKRFVDHGATVIELHGRLDKESIGALEKTLQQLEDESRVKIIIGCKDLEGLPSSAATLFLAHLTRIRTCGGDIRFCDVSSDIRATLVVLGLAKLLVVYDSESQALAGFSERKDKGDEEPVEVLKLEHRSFEDGVTVLTPRGSIQRNTIEQLDAFLKGLLDDDRVAIIIDGVDLKYISSNGMGVFIAYLHKFKNRDGDLRFCRINDIVRTVITTLGLHRMFEIHENLEEALHSYRS